MTWLSPPFSTETGRALVAEIRRVAANLELDDLDSLRELTAQYAEWCSQINERLEACHDLLSEGFLSETLEEVQRPPAVLPLVELFDFPETEAWLELIGEQGLAAPPKLELDLAAELNKAFALADTLRPLLENHRMAAIGRGDLTLRLQLLRQLREAMPSNLGWLDDQKELEKHRLAEIANELEDLKHHGTSHDIALLVQELGGGWLVPVDPSLLDKAKHILECAERSESQRYASEHAQRLLDACNADDVARANAARQQLESLRFDWTQLVTPDIGHRVTEAIAWLDEQNEAAEKRHRFQRLTAQLERLLDEEAAPSELERVYAAMERLELPVPAVIDRRYRARIETASLQKARKYRLAFAVILALLIGSGMGIGYYIRESSRQRLTQAAVAKIKELIHEKNFQGAREVYETTVREHPWAASRPALEAAKQQLQMQESQHRTAEEERRRKFETALAEAQAPGAAFSDRTALRTAAELARTAEEKQLVEKVKRDRERQRLETRKRADERFLSVYDRLEKEIRQMESALEADPTTMVPELKVDRVSNDLTSLLVESSRASHTLRDQAEVLKRRIRSIRDELRMRKRRRELLAELFTESAIASPDAYRDALKQFLRRQPTSAFSPRLRRTLELASTWPMWLEWTQWTSDSTLLSPSQMKPRWAREKLESGNPLAKQFPDAPFTSVFEKQKELLEAVARRVDSNGESILKEVLELKEEPFFGRTWLLVLEDGRKYYLLEEPPEEPTSISYIANLDYKKRTTQIAKKVKQRRISPQRELLEKMEKSLEEPIPADQWAPAVVRWMKEVLDDRDMEPFVKYLLVRHLAAAGSRGSPAIRTAMDRHLKTTLKESLSSQVDWLGHGDENQKARADEERAKLTAKLNALANTLTELDRSQALAQELDQLRQLWHPRVRWLGVVRNESTSDGTLDLVTSEPLKDGRLSVLEGSPTNCRLVTIGQIISGNIEWHMESHRVALGTPVFWVALDRPDRVASR